MRTVSERAICPSCGLEQARRADWLCARCNLPVELEASARRRPAASRAEGDFPTGSRVAGWLALATIAVLGATFGSRMDAKAGLGLLFLGAQSVALIRGSSTIRWVALFSATGGIALSVVQQLAGNSSNPHLLLVGLPCSGFLLLLFGEPGRVRIGRRTGARGPRPGGPLRSVPNRKPIPIPEVHSARPGLSPPPAAR
jgi:hypothetical protein